MAIILRQQKQWIFKVCFFVGLFGTFTDASFLRGSQKSDESVSLDEWEHPEKDFEVNFDSISFDEQSENEDVISKQDLNESYDFTTVDQFDTKQEEEGFYEKYLKPLFGHSVQEESKDEEHTSRNLAPFNDDYSYYSYYSYGRPRGYYRRVYYPYYTYHTYGSPYASYGAYNWANYGPGVAYPARNYYRRSNIIRPQASYYGRYSDDPVVQAFYSF